LGVSTLLLAGCAPRLLSLPTDPGKPLPDFSQIHREATAACADVRTLTAELSLAGRAGGQRLRGRAIVGFERPRSMRLEGVAPFGPPAFILAAHDDLAVLLLPRDNRVLRGERAEDILGALTGVGLAPAELQAVLTGCVSATPGATNGRIYANGWASVELPDGGVLYLERMNTGWRARAARRSGWQIEYPAWQGTFPQTVRLRSTDSGVAVDISATVSQVEANIPVDQAAFTVNAPSDARALTLAELRANGPLGER
jgi:outer membrane biogenesis lipoprotein LolB